MDPVVELIALEDAAKLIPGATKGTLLRRARQGLLKVSRPGRSYVTTRSDLDAMIDACRVKVDRTWPHSVVEERQQMAAANAALDQTLRELDDKIKSDRAEKTRKRQEERAQCRLERVKRKADERRRRQANKNAE